MAKMQTVAASFEGQLADFVGGEAVLHVPYQGAGVGGVRNVVVPWSFLRFKCDGTGDLARISMLFDRPLKVTVTIEETDQVRTLKL